MRRASYAPASKILGILFFLLSAFFAVSSLTSTATAQVRIVTKGPLVFHTNSVQEKTIWVKNFGNKATLAYALLSVQGNNAWDYWDDTQPGLALAPGDSFAVHLTYHPNLQYWWDLYGTCQIDIHDTSGTTLDSIQATATGVTDSLTAGVLHRSDTMLFYGYVEAGSRIEKPVSFRNTWGHPVTLTGMELNGDVFHYFHVSPSLTFPHDLAADDSITFNVTYTPDTLDVMMLRELTLNYHAGVKHPVNDTFYLKLDTLRHGDTVISVKLDTVRHDTLYSKLDTVNQSSIVQLWAQATPPSIVADSMNFGKMSTYTYLYKTVRFSNHSDQTLRVVDDQMMMGDSLWVFLNGADSLPFIRIPAHSTKDVGFFIYAYGPQPVNMDYYLSVTKNVKPYDYISYPYIHLQGEAFDAGALSIPPHFYLYKKQLTLTDLFSPVEEDSLVGVEDSGSYIWLNNTTDTVTVTGAKLMGDSYFHIKNDLNLPHTVLPNDSLVVDFSFLADQLGYYTDYIQLETDSAVTKAPVPRKANPVTPGKPSSSVKISAIAATASMSVSPNPSIGSVNISVQAKPKQIRIEVLDEMGKLVAVGRTANWRWDATSRGAAVPNGAYVIRAFGIDEQNKPFTATSNVVIAR